MAKNRNKKKNDSTAMAVDSSTANNSVADEPQGRSSLSFSMDVSETVAKRDYVGGGLLRKVKAGRPMKRSKNVRKTKALAKALSKSEQSVEKISKSESKVLRTKSAKNLYQ
ncbi:uncharacterized protein LOC125201049 isoform X1 [Salvia hispanica]|uniref:uncharacterized protein LOC125201049 isoform X1 n=1 Tax=Salvia hispanica TaxID=49212 RepID=UPI0020091D9F|nr:uncharacterized protein LOC125201049 isoform X1 [Salvia hispanica]